ncbi:MAG TPA: HEAT repeat domain-containing protein [Vicinamibacterales bacterium]|nr:HEAT repeat domain-containing protein [Vicinamibacterales bacterium]
MSRPEIYRVRVWHRAVRLALPAVIVLSAAASAQTPKFEDVVRNLRNPDQKIRVSAVRLLREAGYAEAIVPMAPLVNDPVNEIQLEAIDSELAFFLVDPVPAKKRVALVVEVRSEGRAQAAFDAGPLAVWPRTAPRELVDALLTAVDDEHKKVRLEAIYTLGVVAGAPGTPLPEAAAARLIKALDHYDPVVRAGAARVIGRVKVTSATDSLLKAVNDSSPAVRYASLRALGDIRDERAVQALTEQFKYYDKGEGAWAALDALARIAHPSSVALFEARVADKDPNLRRAAVEGLARAGTGASVEKFVTAANQDDSEPVRAAMAFALLKQGHVNYLGRLIDFMDQERTAEQVQGYLLELGATVVARVIPRLQEPDEGVREHLAATLGAIGDHTTIAALTPLKDDPDRDVASAATHAIERIKMTQK